MARRLKLIYEPEVCFKKEKSNKVIGKAAGRTKCYGIWGIYHEHIKTHFGETVPRGLGIFNERNTHESFYYMERIKSTSNTCYIDDYVIS